MRAVAMIPARLGSNRFPGKPLALIRGIPMLAHVYYRCRMSPSVDETYVATCDKEIAEYCASIGAKCIMTADTHERASDRIAEAAGIVRDKFDVVVMVQGDEPLLHPGMIDEVLAPFEQQPDLKISNLMARIATREECLDGNTVKVVVDKFANALYFSREPIPSRKHASNGGEIVSYKQLGIIAFAGDFLKLFYETPPTPLERAESVDMMRVVENGHKLKMVLTNHESHAVDTLADLEKVERRMAEDPLWPRYPAGKR